MIQRAFCRLLPFERRQGDMTVAHAGDVTVWRCRFHVDITDDSIADTAVEVALFGNDVVINLNGLGRNPNVF